MWEDILKKLSLRVFGEVRVSLVCEWLEYLESNKNRSYWILEKEIMAHCERLKADLY
jgi:hypothetical protein